MPPSSECPAGLSAICKALTRLIADLNVHSHEMRYKSVRRHSGAATVNSG